MSSRNRNRRRKSKKKRETTIVTKKQRKRAERNKIREEKRKIREERGLIQDAPNKKNSVTGLSSSEEKKLRKYVSKQSTNRTMVEKALRSMGMGNVNVDEVFAGRSDESIREIADGVVDKYASGEIKIPGKKF